MYSKKNTRMGVGLEQSRQRLLGRHDVRSLHERMRGYELHDALLRQEFAQAMYR